MAAITLVKKDVTPLSKRDKGKLLLEDVLTEFREGFNEIVDAINAINTVLKNVDKAISEGGDVINSIGYHAESVRQLKEEALPELNLKIENSAKKVKSDVLVVVNENKGKITDLEGHSRRRNVIINGLDCADEEIPEEVARDFLKEKLSIPAEEVDKFMFRDVHRLPKSKNPDGTVNVTAKKPLILALLKQKDRNHIVSKAYTLKGTVFSLKTDLPKELNELRGRMLKERRRLLDIDPEYKVRVVERSFKPHLQVGDGYIPNTTKTKWIDVKTFP